MKKLVLLSAIVFGLVFYSCSSDDDANVKEEKVSLKGNWQLTNVDYTVMTEGGRPASDACIIELVSGYEFADNSKFYFILGDSDKPLFDPYEKDYWSWEGDVTDFKIKQNNPMSPPYNFGLNPENIKVTEVDGKTTMTFNAVMGNKSEAKFTLVKTANIDKTTTPVWTKPDGTEGYCGFFDPK